MAGGLSYTAEQSTSLSTAEIYGQTLVELGKEHPEIVGLTADLGGSTKIGAFGKVFPDRFFNVGIAEQNMFGIAAGMAKAGLVPFLSTFSQFASFRSADQLHTDLCYQNVNAKVIATHSGTSFGQAGSTHHAICDLAVTRSIPNLTVICPADGYETYNAVMAAYNTPGPFYIRINRGFDRVLYKDANYGFELGKAVEVHAEKGEELLKTMINMDENAGYLGECALVPYDSPIRNSGITFFNTLFDENACCHLALGAGFTNCLKNYEKYTLKECEEKGINDSMIHVDFMIGSEDLAIDAVTKDGKILPIFRDGNWAF